MINSVIRFLFIRKTSGLYFLACQLHLQKSEFNVKFAGKKKFDNYGRFAKTEIRYRPTELPDSPGG